MKLSKDSMVPEGQLQFSVQEESNSLNGVVSQSVLTKVRFYKTMRGQWCK